jgi:indole-3-glycerol phosphate synthase
MNILDKIVADKHKEVQAKQKVIQVDFLKKSPLFLRPLNSMSESIRSGSGIIAEFKRRSPSRSVINQTAAVTDVVRAYEKAGASAISVLGDTKYFGGALEDLIQARNSVDIPVLRKEFIIDPYQIYEAKAFGADAVLLIAAILPEKEITEFSKLAKSLKLEILLEIHNKKELENSDLTYVDMVGVNNRNLKTFEVSLEISKELSMLIPDEKVKVSESGISSVEAINELRNYGYKGFLIGENFMKTDDPGSSAAEFINKL